MVLIKGREVVTGEGGGVLVHQFTSPNHSVHKWLYKSTARRVVCVVDRALTCDVPHEQAQTHQRSNQMSDKPHKFAHSV